MKTKFFKKLSFVLALAMVLSIFAPAAGAFAAKAPKLNSTKRYLHLDVDGKNEFNFNISNKGKGWKYFWESANEDVAVVNEKNGVTTATGAGKTKVQVTITDADDEEVDVLSATVTVRDNIETVKISNPVETLSVGEEHDYNRSYVTVANKTKGSQSVTRWTVEPADSATINDKGVFVATEAGEYTITARSFQSKARYNAWLKDAEANADQVLATDTTKVTVSASIVGLKQLDVQKVEVEFDTPMVEDDVKKNISMSLVIGTVEQTQYLKSVTLDEKTNTKATIELHGPFTKGMTYKVSYPEMDSALFVATTTNFTDVAYITIDTGTAVAGEPTEVEFSLFNSDDVDITNGNDSEYGARLKDMVTLSTDSNGAYIDGNEITIFEVGTVAKVKAVYNTYNYDDEGKEIGAREVTRDIVGVKEAIVPTNSLAAFTIAFGEDGPDWDKLNKQVPVGSDNPRIFAMVKDTDGTEIKSDNTEYAGNFTYELTDDSKLYVSPNGYLYPVEVGNSVVIVKYGDTIVGYANVNIVAEAKASILVLSDYNFTLSTAAEATDSKEVTITVKDQYGNEIDVTDLSVEPLDSSKTFAEANIDVVPNAGDKKVTFTVDTFDVAGKAVYQLEANGFKRTITVALAAPTGRVSYRLDVDNIDLAIEKEENLDKTLGIKLIGYGTNNVKYTSDLASAANIEITGQDGLENGQNLYTMADGVSGGAITKIKTGTYKVVAKYNDGDGERVVATKFFTVTDSQKPALFTKLKEGYYTPGSTLNAVAAECFEIKIDGNEVVADNILEVRTGGGSVDSGSVYITEVDVAQYFGDDAYIVHTVKIGRTVRAK